jgi:hypothetical protein
VDLVVIVRSKASRLTEKGGIAMALNRTLAHAQKQHQKQQRKATH